MERERQGRGGGRCTKARRKSGEDCTKSRRNSGTQLHEITSDPARKGRRSLHESKSEQTGAALSAKGPFCTKPGRNRRGICTRAGRNHTKAAVKENSLSERKERAPPLTADEKTRPGSVPERVGAGGGSQADGFPQARRTERTRNHTSRRQALPVRSTSTSRSSPLRPGTKVW